MQFRDFIILFSRSARAPYPHRAPPDLPGNLFPLACSSSAVFVLSCGNGFRAVLLFMLARDWLSFVWLFYPFLPYACTLFYGPRGVRCGELGIFHWASLAGQRNAVKRCAHCCLFDIQLLQSRRTVLKALCGQTFIKKYF